MNGREPLNLAQGPRPNVMLMAQQLSTLKRSVLTTSSAEVSLRLLTPWGKSILLGRQSKQFARAIIGLKQFNKKIKAMYYSAKLDNPYADMMLLQIEQDFFSSLDCLDKTLETLRHQLMVNGSGYGESFGRQTDLPIEVVLQFRLRYPHLVALLIAYYDQIVFCLKLLKRHGEIDQQVFTCQTQLHGRCIRRLYRYGQFWKNHQLTRVDIVKNTQAYHAAKDYFARTYHLAMTDKILYRDERAKWGPG